MIATPRSLGEPQQVIDAPPPTLCRQDTPATIKTVWEGMDRHLANVPRQGTEK